MSLPVLKKGNNFTYGDYINWPDEERWELIDGYAYNLPLAPCTRHQKISRELERPIANFLLDKSCEVFDAPFDVRFPETVDADENIATVVQPDIAVVCDKKSWLTKAVVAHLI